MAKRIVDLRGQAVPLLDVASYGRRALGQPPLSKAEIEHISRTVRRVPEVMIKVSGGARTLHGVESHLDYIGREGEGEVETDDGQRLREKGFERELLKDWDLDLAAQRRHTERSIAAGRKPPKLVHNLVFSMPKGTPPDRLFKAVRVFAREKFALQHRYAMTLHTDQGHPHVHVVVKAVSEQGLRLNIRKATLREWRRDFAQYLRDVGVEANATERAARGETKSAKRDGIHRAAMRGASIYYRDRTAAVARELAHGELRAELGKARLVATHQGVIGGWKAVADLLDQDGHQELSTYIRQFSSRIPPPHTDRERIAEHLRAAVAAKRIIGPSPER
jgi:hypothetical protein